MNLCIIELPSVTHAQKAKAYLYEKGYGSEIIRNRESCGYSIKVYAPCSKVKDILDSKKIPYKEKGISSW